ncbi:MAG TPA: FkbM family methyltransferase, partial [Burkholderiaceae bacterium]|nr:FkbM family methyltransferase [Burkholderiaceae bacterium]
MNAPAELKQRGEVIPFADPATDPSALDLTAEGRTYSIILPDQATDYIQKKIATERRPYELEMLLDMQRRVAAGDLTLDVGANVGNHTLFLAAVAGCRVVAFEPNRHLCGALLSSVELNGLNGQVHVRALAVGKRAGIARFAQAMPENLGGQRIEVGQGGIQVCALDSLRFEQTVKLIKIDVEGMELDVLTGAAELLRSDRPVLYVECGTEAEFRGVSAWLDNASYSYWDTFNATPTHLFLPNEQLTVEQRIARLQYKVARDDYRTTQQLEVVRKKLDDANLKYRSATEQIATLKQRVAQEEAAQKIGNETAQRLKQQIDEAEKSLAELKTLRDERQQMSVRLAQREAELGVQQAQLDKLEQAGALLRQELSAAVLARQAHELNAARLGEDLARAEEDSKSAWDARNELERALEAARGHAHAQVEAAQARILVLEEQSTDLNAQRQALEEEAASLRTRLGRAEAAAREAGERLAQGEQLALREREDEREHLKRLDWRVAELQARLDATAARETELLGQQCCHLEELVELRTKLATTLQAGESAQARLVEERERHERERASSEVHLQALRERLDAEQRALASANLDLGRRQAEGEALQARLQEAQARIRESAEELSQLKDVVEREIRARHVVEATAASAQAEVASAREALRDFREQLRDVDDQRLPFAALQEQYNLRALVDEIRTSAEADLRSARERIEGIEAVRRQLSDSLADSER